MWLRIQKAIIWLTPNVSSLKKHSTWIRLAILAPLSPTLTTSHTLPTLPILAPALPTYCIHFKATELKRVGTRYQWQNFFWTTKLEEEGLWFAKFFFEKWPFPGLFFVHFITIFTKNICEKCPSSKWYWDSNPRRSDYETPHIITRSGLPSKL